MTTLDTTCEAFSSLATFLWERDHFVIPTIWAVGEERSVFAQPHSQASLDDMASRVALHALMVAACNGHTLGSISEVWVKEQHEDEPVPAKGTFGELSERDPSIHTAIIVHGATADASDERLVLARLVLADDGSTTWDRDSHGSVNGVQHEAIAAVCRMLVNREPTRVRYSVLKRIAGCLGWDVSITEEVD